VPLPQGLIARLARNFLENERGRMQLQMKLLQDQRKENPDAKFTMPTPDQLVQAAQAEAVRNLSIEFVMMALADKEKVEITDADVDTHLAELAKERDKNVARVKAEIQREDPGLQQLRAQLRLEKALDVLESKATITAKA
jgi:trigger factor